MKIYSDVEDLNAKNITKLDAISTLFAKKQQIKLARGDKTFRIQMILRRC